MRKRVESILFWGIVVFYILLLMDVVFLSRLSSGASIRLVNLVPFQSIQSYINVDDGVHYRLLDVNIWGNILLFVPMGIYVPLIKKSFSFLKTLLSLVFISLLIEGIQYLFILGSADIDDVLLNVMGGLLGWVFYRFLLLLGKTPERTKTMVVIISTIVGIPVFILVILLFVMN
jgi:glycopeptide antibiotics resistance protein